VDDVVALALSGVAVVGAAAGLGVSRMQRRRNEHAMRYAHVLHDSRVQFRRVEDDETHLIAALNQQKRINDDLNSFLQRLRDIVMIIPGQRTPVVIRPYVDDVATAAYITVTSTPDGTMTSVTMETYAPDEVFTTVPRGRDLLALPPSCKRNYPSGRLSLEELLRNHRSFIARDRDTNRFHRFTNAVDMVGELQRVHDLIFEWRRSMPAEQLLERDLQAWLGKKYKSQRNRWAKTLAAQMPAARISDGRSIDGSR
jgi:hypothetical protein